MPSRLAFTVVVLLAAVACGRESAAPPSSGAPQSTAPPASKPAGKAAPAFTVKAFTSGGETLDLAALRAKGPVVVNFFESWCGTCNHEQPDIDAAATAYAGRVSFVGLSNRDTVKDGLEYAERHKVPYPLAHAPAVWEDYGVPFQPATVVISADGRELKRWQGAVTEEQLTEALDAALAG